MMKYFFDRAPRYFFVLFIVFFAGVFFSLYESFRTYRAEAELLIISKSPAVSAEATAATIARFPGMLSFYDRLLADHDNITDPWSGLSSIDRKNHWDGVIESTAFPSTALVSLAVSSPDSSQAEAFLNASLETLYGFSGRLYDREQEADIRLVDGVTVHPMLTQSWALFSVSTFLAAIFAFLAAILLRTSLSTLRGVSFSGLPSLRTRMFSKITEPLRPVGTFPEIDLPKEMPLPEAVDTVAETKLEAKDSDEPRDIWEKSRPVATEKLRIQRTTVEIPVPSVAVGAPVVSESPSTLPQGKSVQTRLSAPQNLPTVSAQDFTWEKYLFQNEEMQKESEKDEKSPEVSPAPVSGVREPTPEELKARLNQLLRGEM